MPGTITDTGAGIRFTGEVGKEGGQGAAHPARTKDQFQ